MRASNSSLAAYPAHAHAYPILLERERSVAFAYGKNGSSEDQQPRLMPHKGWNQYKTIIIKTIYWQYITFW